MTETVLFYFPAGAEGAAAARKTLAIQKVRVRTIAPEQTGSAVGWLAGLPGSNREETAETPPKEAVLVFCGFSDRRLDAVLAALRKAGVPRSVYRAALTESNAGWSFAALCRELAGERAAIARGETEDGAGNK